ncbi:RND efflux system, membrane fusion protein CmeA [Candidatus Burkholderia verschuerenii]|uniref:RND efflux system, membrane fusion protein CmeA n=1 Tax=Candidatus Burkholderia verschuerenii TaxID=242163 RepID=A0A0L0MCC4_9BURK|nr:efflux RND transporter periplasmic adaptor subunit [Candidatus Burkholderia verschuerenii]KND59915.1 RND efflux system, membrane fusion protein CmeA [Candidatus Burkholderia verschuerenii]
MCDFSPPPYSALARPLPAWRAACLMVVALSGCGRPQADTPPPPEVGVASVIRHDVHLSDEFNGRVEAVDAVELRPRVSGYLQRVAFREGESVAQGALLFVIDQRPYHIALDRANAQSQRAQAAARLAKLQLERVETLIKARATSQEELDSARAVEAQASADLHAAQAAVDDAKLNLGFTEVRAPISGRAGRAVVTVGNLAQADQTLLTTVVSEDPVYVYFDCDEQSYLRYSAARTDANRRAIGAANVVHIGLANETGFPHEGSIDFLDNRLDASTGTIRARVRVANTDHAFVPGLYARVQLVGGRDERALLVDGKAVLTDQDRRYVYVLGDGNRAMRRDVTLGRDIGGKRIVTSGLRDGDRVIVEGLQRVYFSGAPVKPKALPAGPKQGEPQQ